MRKKTRTLNKQKKSIGWLDRYGDCICCLGTHILSPLHPEDDEVPIVNSSSALSSEADSLQQAEKQPN